MTHAIRAALALALGLGIATAAQAQDTPRQNVTAQPNMHAATTGKIQHARANRHMAKPKMVRQTQQRMKAQGFYKGPIDGKWTPQTQRAFAKFQKQNQPTRAARLNNHKMVAHSGSSMPRHAAKKATGQQQAMPKQTPAPSTGSSTPPADPNAPRQ